MNIWPSPASRHRLVGRDARRDDRSTSGGPRGPASLVVLWCAGMFDLARFRDAQDSPDAGFACALSELEAGGKTSHWIWYIFPQLAGLGESPMSVRYGLDGPEEAAAYLGDGVLTDRLVTAASVVRAHVASQGQHPAPLEQVMGSRIDATKLVSCMTLFAGVAKRLRSTKPAVVLDTLVGHADAILAAAGLQGYPRCTFTEVRMASAKS
jgi:uncharacterized protein (DUF1810 family)